MTALPLRLERDPSLGAELRQAVIYAAVPSFIAAVTWWGWKTGPAEPPPPWVWFAAPLFVLALVGFLWNVVARLARLIRGHVPIVEVDAQPWHPGQEVRVRIVHPDAARLRGLDVLLVAEDVRVNRVPLTTASSGGWRFTEVVRFHSSILALDAAALEAAGPLDRTVTLTVPAEASASAWRWQVLIAGRGRGGLPQEDRYPVAISRG